MKTQSGLVALIVILLSPSVAAADTQPAMIKIAQHAREIFLKDIHKADFRLAYIKQSLRDELIAEESILVDTTGMPMPETKTGIYKLKLISDNVPAVFSDIIQKTGFVHKGYPLCLFVQEGRATRLSPEAFLVEEQWREAKIKPGDIIVLMR